MASDRSRVVAVAAALALAGYWLFVRPGTAAGARLADLAFWEPAHFVMERRMLHGMKERVESA